MQQVSTYQTTYNFTLQKLTEIYFLDNLSTYMTRQITLCGLFKKTKHATLHAY